MKHQLKTWPEYFQAIWDGRKHFELRVNDRDFKVGDTLVLNEYSPGSGEYSGRICIADVEYMVQGVFGLPDDLCIMSFASAGRWDFRNKPNIFERGEGAESGERAEQPEQVTRE